MDLMRNEIEAALRGLDAEYVDLRLEEGDSTRLVYRGRELEDVGRSRGRGGCVRALAQGGWGFVCFNDWSSLQDQVHLAVQQAHRVPGDGRRLAPAASVVDHVPPVLGRDPRAVPLAQKKEILDSYNELIWSTPDIQTSSIGYGDGSRRSVFANSEGSYIEQERVDVTLRVSAIAQHDGDIQQASFSVGSLGDFTLVEGQAAAVAATARRAGELLRAPYPQARAYTVVLDPILAGVFTHEAFGHLSESDHVYENPQMRDIMVLGKQFGPAHLNIVDGAAVGGLRGSYRYDDEGVPATRTDLIREGILVGRLHSRETAGLMGELPTGNARAINYRFPPIVRMTNTFIEPGEMSLAEILADVDDGIYACNWYGGTTSMEMFTFSAGEAYRIRQGRIEELLRGAVLSGNLFQTLQNIDAIGNDLAMNQGGGCGKRGQSPLPVSNGSPHIRIRDCVVGGK